MIKYEDWFAVMVDELMLCALSMDSAEDPKKALNEIIAWHSAVAVDPKVSSEARELVEAGRRQADTMAMAMLRVAFMNSKDSHKVNFEEWLAWLRSEVGEFPEVEVSDPPYLEKFRTGYFHDGTKVAEGMLLFGKPVKSMARVDLLAAFGKMAEEVQRLKGTPPPAIRAREFMKRP